MIAHRRILNQLRLSGGVLSLLWLIGLLERANANSGRAETENSSVQLPLIYTRLRHDYDNLNILLSYQHYLRHLERRQTFSYNLSHGQANGRDIAPATREVRVEYYENPQVEALNITHDDLVLEALDALYKMRLQQESSHLLADESMRTMLADKRLVNRAQCKRELDFLNKKMLIHKSQMADYKTSAEPQHMHAVVSPELEAFFDSYASDEPGLLFGNRYWTGNWRQCQRRHIIELDKKRPNESYSFVGRYCISMIQSKSWQNKIKRLLQKTQQANFFKDENQEHGYMRHFHIQVGICLPQSCDSTSIYEFNESISLLTKAKLGPPYNSYDVVDMFCLPDETSEFRQPSVRCIVVSVLILFWCLLIILATWIDSGTRKTSDKAEDARARIINIAPEIIERFVSSLSMSRNLERINRAEKYRPTRLVPTDLSFFNFIKVIGTPIIMSGHVSMITKHIDKYPLFLDSVDNKLFLHFMLNSVFAVDWYLCMTAFILTYSSFVTQKVLKYRRRDWALSVVHRYMRVIPLYVFWVWFSKDVYEHLSSGPNWDYGHSNGTMRAKCRRESFLWSLTLTSNFKPLYDNCISPSWYICCDMQFYLITPFLLVLLAKSAKLGWAVCVSGIVGSCALRFHMYMTDPNVRHSDLARVRPDAWMQTNWDTHANYLQPHYRVSTWLVGILAGHYAYMTLTGRWKNPFFDAKTASDHRLARTDGTNSNINSNGNTNNSNHNHSDNNGRAVATKSSPNLASTHFARLALLTSGCCTVTMMLFASLISTQFLVPDWAEPKQIVPLVSLGYSTHDLVMSLGFSGVLLALIYGTAEPLRRFFSWPVWTRLSRINYFPYIAQLEIIFWYIQTNDQVMQTNDAESLKILFSVTIISYILSLVATLLIEMPMSQLEQKFISAPTRNDKHSMKQQPLVYARQTSHNSFVSERANSANRIDEIIELRVEAAPRSSAPTK